MIILVVKLLVVVFVCNVDEVKQYHGWEIAVILRNFRKTKLSK